MTYYEVGDVVSFHVDGLGPGEVLVIARIDDMMDGRPGLVGQRLHNDEERMWLFDSEIIEVTDSRAIRAARQHVIDTFRGGHNDYSAGQE